MGRETTDLPLPFPPVSTRIVVVVVVKFSDFRNLKKALSIRNRIRLRIDIRECDRVTHRSTMITLFTLDGCILSRFVTVKSGGGIHCPSAVYR